MKFLYYLIEIPLVLIAVWLVVDARADGDVFIFELWPLETEVNVNAKLTLCVLILYGYIWAKINSWFAYSPVRQALRSQKKVNKVLNKEQEKLNETVSGLQKNLVGLQEKAKLQGIDASKDVAQKTANRTSSFIAKLFGRKKEN